MEKNILDDYKERLIKQRLDILQDAYKTLNGQVHDQKGGIPDTVDRSTLETDRNFELRLRDRDRKLLKKVEEALERIDKNTFGLCRGCGGYIGEKRLNARPVATLCIQCKEEQEQAEKQNKK